MKTKLEKANVFNISVEDIIKNVTCNISVITKNNELNEKEIYQKLSESFNKIQIVTK